MTVAESEAIVENFSRFHKEDMSRMERAVHDEREHWEWRMGKAGEDLINQANGVRRWAALVEDKFLREMLELHAQFIQDRAETMLAEWTIK